jgi:para-nitrobenzyl esterase
MVWFHGGAFITGGGELPWYDGDLLAAQQDVVVVTVTARLGALGYLCLDRDRPSPAATDQMTAIEWVHRYIDQFGGDPDNITLFGQSAGGFAIEVMLRWGVGPYVRGAILQSAFIKQDGITYRPADAARQADTFTAFVDCDLRSLPVAELLAAQDEFAKQAGTVEVWAPVRPPVERQIELPLIAGFTTHDTLPFVLMKNGISKPRSEHFDVFREEVDRRNHVEISRGNYDTLDEACRSGQRCWLYEFDCDVPGSGWGAPHCIELPFLLGHWEAWSSAAILHGADEDVFHQRGRSLRAIWGSFAHRRHPGVTWVEYDAETRVANRLSPVLVTE